MSARKAGAGTVLIIVFVLFTVGRLSDHKPPFPYLPADWQHDISESSAGKQLARWADRVWPTQEAPVPPFPTKTPPSGRAHLYPFEGDPLFMRPLSTGNSRSPGFKLTPLRVLEVTSVRFFESGKGYVERPSYSSVFQRDAVRYINYDLSLSYVTWGDIKVVWYRNGIKWFEQTLKAGQLRNGCGWDERGHWTPGAYKVEFLLGGSLVLGKGEFEIRAAGFIPMKVNSVRFFESGKGFVERSSYSSVFQRDAVRYINYDLSLSRPASGDIKVVWYRNGVKMYEQTLKAGQLSYGCGWAETGHWTPGAYKVEFLLEGSLVGKGEFEIRAANPFEEALKKGEPRKPEPADHPTAGSLSAQEVFDRANPSVVFVHCPGGDGSGFIVSSDGTIVTNYHVIRAEREVVVQVVGGAQYPVTGVAAWDPIHDYAVLKISGSGLPALKIGDAKAVLIGEKVVAIGNPEGLSHTLSDGLVSQIRTVKDSQGQEKTMFQISVPIDHGSSGGPLLNMRGEVIGITSSGIEKTHANLNFAVPISYVRLSGLNRVWTLNQVADWQKSEDQQEFQKEQQEFQKELQANFPGYKDPDGRFSVEYPRDWRIDRCSFQPSYRERWGVVSRTRFLPSGTSVGDCEKIPSEGAWIDFASLQPGQKMDLDEWVKGTLDVWAGNAGFVETEQPRALNFAGLSARIWEAEFADPPTVRRSIVAWHRAPDFAVTFGFRSLKSPDSHLQENASRFQIMRATFKLGDARNSVENRGPRR